MNKIKQSKMYTFDAVSISALPSWLLPFSSCSLLRHATSGWKPQLLSMNVTKQVFGMSETNVIYVCVEYELGISAAGPGSSLHGHA